ncbi:hypothetical protein FRACYDRAFT_267573 [Fragilariopsis cylindrus CCMP1102]|uniref:Uncharacterized protein n=1 Tax=Fragilariopsis cylindrus CCMP1102 TaxID=635003 RepID=A0A1E7FZY3_9STRA|nr:hypothetical protein FRACYDRAFT_267573 [Fragilariopsis cylindrus CCMP1102]|eukprot:OEU23674.1 hypothetical protein FRACYDRAFT_267573 [Fragilariopsis cylindrus CCMP1102]
MQFEISNNSACFSFSSSSISKAFWLQKNIRIGTISFIIILFILHSFIAIYTKTNKVYCTVHKTICI